MNLWATDDNVAPLLKTCLPQCKERLDVLTWSDPWLSLQHCACPLLLSCASWSDSMMCAIYSLDVGPRLCWALLPPAHDPYWLELPLAPANSYSFSTSPHIWLDIFLCLNKGPMSILPLHKSIATLTFQILVIITLFLTEISDHIYH